MTKTGKLNKAEVAALRQLSAGCQFLAQLPGIGPQRLWALLDRALCVCSSNGVVRITDIGRHCLAALDAAEGGHDV